MRIVFASSVSNLTEQNSSFDSGVLRVAYTGKNRNNSFISRETYERCIPSIYNCPIVCRYDRETDSIGSHDMELVTDGHGDMRIVNVTQPVGVVPESARYWWEDIEDDSGVHEYLCIETLLWKRQEAYKKIKSDGITSESMEITVKDGSMVDGVYVIRDFEFTAFCLLGSAEPCFESAALETFACDDFKEQFSLMMKELKETIATVSNPNGEENMEKEFSTEGGEEILEEKIALASEYGLDVESLDFSVEDLTVDELREKFEALKTADDEQPDGTGDKSGAFALESTFVEELIGSLESEKVETCWGMESRYWFWDYDREAGEVYATDTADWNLYGFSYSMDGDNVVIDFASKKRMKITIAPFDEGSASNQPGTMFAKIVEKYTANDRQWSEKYQTISDKASSMEGELDTLRQFKRDTESAAAAAEREQVFSRFDDLNGIEAFENLRENCADIPAEDLEEKCYAIRGRLGTPARFSAEPAKQPKIKVPRTEIAKEPYGGVFAEYGITPANSK